MPKPLQPSGDHHTWEQEAAEEQSLYRSVQEWNMFPEQAAELLEHVFVPEGIVGLCREAAIQNSPGF